MMGAGCTVPPSSLSRAHTFLTHMIYYLSYQHMKQKIHLKWCVEYASIFVSNTKDSQNIHDIIFIIRKKFS